MLRRAPSRVRPSLPGWILLFASLLSAASAGAAVQPESALRALGKFNTESNLTVELSTMGDMKIVERPQSQTIGPLDQMTIRASIKVSSTETGHIFGTIVYEDTSTREKGYINLNDIHMDIMDYIRPAICTDEIFRSMWAEFEWENKVAIATSITDLIEFVDHIVTSTNMSCLTPHDRSEKGSFLAANLYAKR